VVCDGMSSGERSLVSRLQTNSTRRSPLRERAPVRRGRGVYAPISRKGRDFAKTNTKEIPPLTTRSDRSREVIKK
jgi:hypothetical protein